MNIEKEMAVRPNLTPTETRLLIDAAEFVLAGPMGTFTQADFNALHHASEKLKAIRDNAPAEFAMEEVHRVVDEDGKPTWELKTHEGSEFMEEVQLRAEHFKVGTVITTSEPLDCAG
jgi:hypothetical protein